MELHRHRNVSNNDHVNLKLIFKKNERTWVILITITFLFFASYAALGHHPYFAEDDGIYYIKIGEEILKGNYQNIKIPDAPPGGPIFYASINQLINDDFLTLKLIAIIGSTCIIFVSYFVIRNIFSYKIAIVSQLLIATNFYLFFLSFSALNEVIPLLLIFTSLYFITKQKFSIYDIIFCGILLGVAASFRYQAVLVVISIIIYLGIRNREIKNNFRLVVVFSVFFILALSPILILNFTSHDNFVNTNGNEHIRWQWKIQTPEWRQNAEEIILSGSNKSVAFLDMDLFFKNYFYNFFYNNPNKLFNFNTTNTISNFPLIPMLGIVTFSISYIYIINFRFSKTKIIVIGASIVITLFAIYQIGDINQNWFALIFAPLLVIGIMNFKKIQGNLLLIMILALVFLVIISMSHVSRAYQLFPMWLIFPALNAVFFVEIIPKIFSKLKIHRNQTEIISIIIVLVIILNLGTSFATSYMVLYPHEFNGIVDEIRVILSKESFNPQGYQSKIVSEILSQEKNIETSYIMTNTSVYSYFSGGKWISTTFTEGKQGDSIQNYINRENWSDYDLYMSDLGSSIFDSSGVSKQIPDYIIFENVIESEVEPHRFNSTQYKDLKILLEPNNPKIPANFEMLWISEEKDLVIYKINK